MTALSSDSARPRRRTARGDQWSPIQDTQRLLAELAQVGESPELITSAAARPLTRPPLPHSP